MTDTKRVGVAVDSYKVQRFCQVLAQKGYKVETGPGLVSDTRMLYLNVQTDQLKTLEAILRRLQTEFRNRN